MGDSCEEYVGDSEGYARQGTLQLKSTWGTREYRGQEYVGDSEEYAREGTLQLKSTWGTREYRGLKSTRGRVLFN